MLMPLEKIQVRCGDWLQNRDHVAHLKRLVKCGFRYRTLVVEEGTNNLLRGFYSYQFAKWRGEREVEVEVVGKRKRGTIFVALIEVTYPLTESRYRAVHGMLKRGSEISRPIKVKKNQYGGYTLLDGLVRLEVARRRGLRVIDAWILEEQTSLVNSGKYSSFAVIYSSDLSNHQSLSISRNNHEQRTGP